MLLNFGVWEMFWKVLWNARKSALNIHWKERCWSWNSNSLATWSKELTHLKRPWCWERLKVGEGDDREWDGWMASPTQQTRVSANSRSWWWTGRLGMWQSMGLQWVGHDWATELNWIPLSLFFLLLLPSERDPKYIAVTDVKVCLTSVLF